MSYQTIITELRNSLQTAYRQSLDADAVLEQLQQQGQGKFATIFPTEAKFKTQSNRFGPYVSELADRLVAFEQQPNTTALAQLVQQMEVLLTTLSHFRQQVKGH